MRLFLWSFNQSPKKEKDFFMKSFSACSQQWEAAFIQELARVPAAPASLGDTRVEHNVHFLFFGRNIQAAIAINWFTW